ncbi:MAG: hypothetical protein KC656_37490, partial [Myxococcales bacterium]|nr:hypothetical protein [Myxococcales bacterium]
MPTQLLVSLLPLAYADRRAETCVIGLASGITAGAVTLYEDVERVDVVELEPATVPAARIFTPWNFGLLDDPRTRLILDDGRNHVLRAPPEAYDVLVSEPSNPWITGVSNLFTAEFFALGRERVRPGGTWGQWVQLYGLGPDEVRALVRTFQHVFPDTWLFETIPGSDALLLGRSAGAGLPIPHDLPLAP